ncbi:MAG TPA: hypothetical protein VHB51_03365 [Candidatus Saccharimonadales bacterium]|nr:hypothetical protein [Candidatus Saccharimonadales bacterium]
MAQHENLELQWQGRDGSTAIPLQFEADESARWPQITIDEFMELEQLLIDQLGTQDIIQRNNVADQIVDLHAHYPELLGQSQLIRRERAGLSPVE